MTPSPPSGILLRAVCVAAICGSLAGLSRLPYDFEPGRHHPGWIRRYEVLTEPLRGERAALLVSDDQGGTPKYKAFRAQFTLAPVVIQYRDRLATVDLAHVLGTPLVIDASSPASADEMVAELERRARRDGVELIVRRLPFNLVVVRARVGP